jgi:hypothetical protein
VDFAGTVLREILGLFGYALVFFGVYKLHQINTDLSEIKELLKRRQESAELMGSTPVPTPDFHSSPSIYAETLMRALDAQQANRRTAEPSTSAVNRAGNDAPE